MENKLSYTIGDGVNWSYFNGGEFLKLYQKIK